MATERLSATLSIGSVLEGSIRRNVSVLRSGLDSVGDSISKVARRQKELEKNRKVLEREGRSVAELDREYEELGHTLDQLRRKQERLEGVSKAVGRVSRDAAAVGRDLRRMAIGAAAGATAAGAAIFSVASSTAALGDEVAKTAAKVGVGVEPLQELRYAAQRSGVEIDNLDEGLKEVQLRLADAKRGAGPAVEALDELGLSADALSRMRSEDAIGAIADALKKVENNGDKVFLVDALMGEDGVKMLNLLKQGSEGIQQLRRDAQATGYVLSEKAARDAEVFQDRLLDTKLTLVGLKNVVGAELLPVISNAMSDFSGWARFNQSAVRDFAETMVTGLETAIPVLRQVLWGMGEMTGVVWQGVAGVADFVGGWENLGKVIGGLALAKTAFRIGRLAVSVGRLGGALWTLGGGTAVAALPLAVLAGAAYLASSRMEGISDWVRERGTEVRSFFEGLGDYVAGVWTLDGERAWAGAKTAMGAVFDFVEGHGDAVINTVVAIGTELRRIEGVDAIWQTVATGIGSALESIKGPIDAAIAWIDGVIGKLRSVTEGVRDAISAARKHQSEGSVYSIDKRADAARDYPYHPASALRERGELVPGGIQKRAAGGTFGAGPLLVGEDGPEAMWASRGGYVSTRREIEGLQDLARRALGDLGRAAGRASGTPSAPLGGAPIVVNINGSNLSADEVLAAARREERRRSRRALHDAPSGLGQYGAG